MRAGVWGKVRWAFDSYCVLQRWRGLGHEGLGAQGRGPPCGRSADSAKSGFWRTVRYCHGRACLTRVMPHAARAARLQVGLMMRKHKAVGAEWCDPANRTPAFKTFVEEAAAAVPGVFRVEQPAKE